MACPLALSTFFFRKSWLLARARVNSSKIWNSGTRQSFSPLLGVSSPRSLLGKLCASASSATRIVVDVVSVVVVVALGKKEAWEVRKRHGMARREEREERVRGSWLRIMETFREGERCTFDEGGDESFVTVAWLCGFYGILRTLYRFGWVYSKLNLLYGNGVVKIEFYVFRKDFVIWFNLYTDAFFVTKTPVKDVYVKNFKNFGNFCKKYTWFYISRKYFMNFLRFFYRFFVEENKCEW